MKIRNAPWALAFIFMFITLASLACNLTGYRPTQTPPTVQAGDWVNPYLRIALDGVTAVQIHTADPATPGVFIPAGTLTGADLDKLMTALNVSVAVEARNLACPDHLRLIFVWPDASQHILSACLDGTVKLRGVPGTDKLDVPMYGATSDVLAPYLTDALRARLDS